MKIMLAAVALAVALPGQAFSQFVVRVNPGAATEVEPQPVEPRVKDHGVQVIIIKRRDETRIRRDRRATPPTVKRDDAPPPATTPETVTEAEAVPVSPLSKVPRFESVAPLPAVAYEIGGPLPPGPVTRVSDWRSYDLPPPPSGHFYVRRGRDIVLITSDERRVARVFYPDQEAPAEPVPLIGR